MWKGYVDNIYNATMDKNKEKMKKKKFGSVSMRQPMQRVSYVANVIIGTLDENCTGNAFLLNLDWTRKN